MTTDTTSYEHNQISTSDKQVHVGERYLYTEDGFEAEVKVLATEHTDDGIGFRLLITKRLRWPKGSPDVFSCWARSGHYAYGGMWRLSDCSPVI
jgi:hypothetical protein